MLAWVTSSSSRRSGQEELTAHLASVTGSSRSSGASTSRLRAASFRLKTKGDEGEALEKLSHLLSEARLSRRIDEFIAQKNIIPVCDTVLEATGSVFEGVYLAVWNLIMLVEGEQIALYIKTVRPLIAAAKDGPGRGRVQQTVDSDVVKLYVQAAEIKSSFDEVVQSLAKTVGVKVDIPKNLKRISRVLEKAYFDFDDPGKVFKIGDIIRASMTATSILQVTKLCLAFLDSDDIVLVRVKDRFVEQPSHGGWRDLMINFYLADDPRQHICEVQVVLEKMLVARKGLGGHHGYGYSRNALETLEKLGVSDPACRWRRAAYLVDVHHCGADELLHLGFEVIDLVRAGLDESDLAGKEGVTESAMKMAKQVVTPLRARDYINPEAQKQTLEEMQRLVVSGSFQVVHRSVSRSDSTGASAGGSFKQLLRMASRSDGPGPGAKHARTASFSAAGSSKQRDKGRKASFGALFSKNGTPKVAPAPATGVFTEPTAEGGAGVPLQSTTMVQQIP